MKKDQNVHNHKDQNLLFKFCDDDLDHLKIINDQKFLDYHQVFFKSKKSIKDVVVFCSAGLDSTCLVHGFLNLKLKKSLNFNVLLFHINFNLRDSSSTVDQEFVRKLADKLALEYISVNAIYKYKNPVDQINDISSKQLWARSIIGYHIKYFIDKNYIVSLGHHKDDLIETILFRTFRGTNPWHMHGLSRWSGNVFRPLLELDKNTLYEYAKFMKIDFTTDQSNFDHSPSRNKIRLNIIPEIKKISKNYSRQITILSTKCCDMADYIRSSFLLKIDKKHQKLSLDYLRDKKPSIIQLALESLASTKLSLSTKNLNSLVSLIDKVSDINLAKKSDSFSQNKIYKFKIAEGDFIIYKNYIYFKKLSEINHNFKSINTNIKANDSDKINLLHNNKKTQKLPRLNNIYDKSPKTFLIVPYLAVSIYINTRLVEFKQVIKFSKKFKNYKIPSTVNYISEIKILRVNDFYSSLGNIAKNFKIHADIDVDKDHIINIQKLIAGFDKPELGDLYFVFVNNQLFLALIGQSIINLNNGKIYPTFNYNKKNDNSSNSSNVFLYELKDKSDEMDLFVEVVFK